MKTERERVSMDGLIVSMDSKLEATFNIDNVRLRPEAIVVVVLLSADAEGYRFGLGKEGDGMK